MNKPLDPYYNSEEWFEQEISKMNNEQLKQLLLRLFLKGSNRYIEMNEFDKNCTALISGITPNNLYKIRC